MTEPDNNSDSPTPQEPDTQADPAPAPTTIDSALEAEIAAALGDVSIDAIEEMTAAPTIHMTSDGRQTRTGTIARVENNDVLIEFGPKSNGLCPLVQFETPPEKGSTHEFVVERFDPFDGILIVSLPGAVQKADWGSLEVGQVIEARCVGMNRGGLEMEVDHHKAFMPTGQVDVRHIEDVSVLIGEKFPCKVIELKKNKNRLVLSRKAVMQAERETNRGKILEELEVGQVRSVTVSSVQAYGAFADLGGIDGLIHVSDLAHDRVKHPSDVVKVGDTFEVEVLSIDREHKPPRIGLGRKQVTADPGTEAMAEVGEGAELSGTVTKITEFGAFVEVAPGVEGLVHISQLAHERVNKVEDVLRKGEVIQVKVLSIDVARKRISLSMKALLEAPKREAQSGGKRGRRDFADSQEPRAEDPEMRKLKARFSDSGLKGGLG